MIKNYTKVEGIVLQQHFNDPFHLGVKKLAIAQQKKKKNRGRDLAFSPTQRDQDLRCKKYLFRELTCAVGRPP